MKLVKNQDVGLLRAVNCTVSLSLFVVVVVFCLLLKNTRPFLPKEVSFLYKFKHLFLGDNTNLLKNLLNNLLSENIKYLTDVILQLFQYYILYETSIPSGKLTHIV